MSYVATGLPPGPRVGNSAIWTPERKAEVKRMALNGMTYSQIGIKLGVSRCSIGGVVGRLKDVGEYPRLAPKKIRLIVPKLHKPASARINGWEQATVAKMPSTDERLLRPAQGSGIAITELGARQCRFATGYDKQGNHLFCGLETNGSSWCQHHAARVFKKAGTDG